MPTLLKFLKSTVVLLRFFKRYSSRCKNGSPDLHKFAASRRQISSVPKCSYSVTPSNGICAANLCTPSSKSTGIASAARVARSLQAFTAPFFRYHGPFKAFHGPKICRYGSFHGPKNRRINCLFCSRKFIKQLFNYTLLKQTWFS
jgi:hypothetical protein